MTAEATQLTRLFLEQAQSVGPPPASGAADVAAVSGGTPSGPVGSPTPGSPAPGAPAVQAAVPATTSRRCVTLLALAALALRAGLVPLDALLPAPSTPLQLLCAVLAGPDPPDLPPMRAPAATLAPLRCAARALVRGLLTPDQARPALEQLQRWAAASAAAPAPLRAQVLTELAEADVALGWPLGPVRQRLQQAADLAPLSARGQALLHTLVSPPTKLRPQVLQLLRSAAPAASVQLIHLLIPLSLPPAARPDQLLWRTHALAAALGDASIPTSPLAAFAACAVVAVACVPRAPPLPPALFTHSIMRSAEYVQSLVLALETALRLPGENVHLTKIAHSLLLPHVDSIQLAAESSLHPIISVLPRKANQSHISAEILGWSTEDPEPSSPTAHRSGQVNDAFIAASKAAHAASDPLASDDSLVAIPRLLSLIGQTPLAQCKDQARVLSKDDAHCLLAALVGCTSHIARDTGEPGLPLARYGVAAERVAGWANGTASLSERASEVGRLMVVLAWKLVDNDTCNPDFWAILGDAFYVSSSHQQAMAAYLNAASIERAKVGELHLVHQTSCLASGWRQLIASCLHSQLALAAAVLCQFPNPPEFALGLRLIQEHILHLDNAIAGFLWEPSFLELGAHLLAKLRDESRLALVTSQMARPELAPCTDPQYRRKHVGLLMSNFLRALRAHFNPCTFLAPPE